mmetsp:Transcript_49892/g.138603  ORF Transcript_49892/g.138603 Transcript_49892/m.138603 type:complete len:282 (+) Transcript_49892:897-1742(+)
MHCVLVTEQRSNKYSSLLPTPVKTWLQLVTKPSSASTVTVSSASRSSAAFSTFSMASSSSFLAVPPACTSSVADFSNSCNASIFLPTSASSITCTAWSAIIVLRSWTIFLMPASKWTFSMASFESALTISAVFRWTLWKDIDCSWHFLRTVMLGCTKSPPKHTESMDVWLKPKDVPPMRRGTDFAPQKLRQTSAKPATSMTAPSGRVSLLQKSLSVFAQKAAFNVVLFLVDPVSVCFGLQPVSLSASRRAAKPSSSAACGEAWPAAPGACLSRRSDAQRLK